MRAWTLEPSAKAPTLSERPRPSAGPGEVLVRTTAMALHPVDLETMKGGNSPLLALKWPFVLGVDFAGQVEALGEGVRGFSVGDAVYGYRGVPVQGAFAELLVAPAEHLAKAPAGFAPEALATFPLPIHCALQGLGEAEVGAGQRVLVHGGAGGVGSVAVQMFAARGLEVIATASAKDADWVRSLGASQVIDYRSTRFEDAVSDLDLVFDTVGTDTLSRSFAVVKPGGAVVSLAAMPPAWRLRDAGFSLPFFMPPLLALMGWSLNRRAARAKARLIPLVSQPSGALLAEAAGYAEARGLHTRIDRTFPFEELDRAVEYYASGEARGRVVVLNS